MIILSYIIHKWEGLFCRRAQCLIYVICVCLRIVVSNTYCVVFVYVYWCPTHIVLCFCFVYLRLVCPVLPGSLECPFWITPSCCQVLWNVHSGLPLRVARFSGMSILDYPFVLPGSLECPFWITPSCCQVLWIVHSWLPLRVARFSGLSILYYPFSFSNVYWNTQKNIFFIFMANE